MYKPQAKPDFNIPEIVSQFSTPLIIYSINELNRKITELKSVIPAGSQLLYSVKANPMPFVINLLKHAGLGFEVASAGELHQLIKLKVCPERIVLGGPIKSKEAIASGLQNNILSYNVESEQDLLNIMRAANLPLNISLRINPDFSNRSSEIKMGGISSQFGIDENQLIPLIRKYRNVVNINGLFMFAGSQFFDAQKIIQNTSFLIEFAEKHKDEFNQLDFLDFGGGFGIVESANQPGLNMSMLKSGLDDLFESKEQFLDTIKYKFFESGRYLTASSAILVSRVLDIKYSKGKKYILLDTGINHLGIRQLDLRTRESFISTVKEYHEHSPAILTGATCTPIDVIQSENDFPDVAIDDLVLIHNVGAYTATLSPYNFCGYTYPAEVSVNARGDVSLIRERGDIKKSSGPGYK